MTDAVTDPPAPAPDPARPEGEYAIVEVLGHRTIVGRTSEVERFGTKFLAVEPIWEGALLPAVLIGGASIYQLTPCSAEVAFVRAPKHHHQLPPSIAVTVPKPIFYHFTGACDGGEVIFSLPPLSLHYVLTPSLCRPRVVDGR